MTGENPENVAGATNSAVTPPAGLTRREMREWERANGIVAAPVVQTPTEPTVQAETVPATPAPVSPVAPTAEQPLSRRELRQREAAGNTGQTTQPLIEAPVEAVVAPADVEMPVVAEQVHANEPVSEPEPVVAAAVTEEKPVASKTPTTSAHKLINRSTPLRRTFMSNRSKRERTAAEKRSLITRRVVSVLALAASFAFALSVSIPATAMLTQEQVAQMKMQSFIDEQVNLASQSVSVRSEAGTSAANRDGVDISYAAQAAPVKYYGNSGLCGEETEVSPPVSNGPIVFPLESPKISSGYGYRWGSLHAGIDFEGSVGIPIYAAADGIVKATMPSAYNALGICTIISHNVNGVKFDTLYGHLSSLNFSVGQVVTAGQLVGAMGSTGVSTGPHLHFEVHVNGVQIDPAPFMATYAG